METKDGKVLKLDPEQYKGIKELVESVVRESVSKTMHECNINQKNNSKLRYDKRLKNTTLLLKNYKKFQEHCENAVYEIAESIKTSESEDEEILSIFDKIYDVNEDRVIIESILRSKARTMIILKHITKCIEFYKYSAITSTDKELQRRCRVIEMLYLDKEIKNYDEIAEIEYISTKTVNRDRKKAVSELAPLIFGVDGIDI